MGRFDGKVALITGGARGQGRAHAQAFAREGADVVVVDGPARVTTAPYELGSMAELRATAALVEEQGRRCLALEADVRDQARLHEVVEQALGELGAVDVCVANAAIHTYGELAGMDAATWEETVDINLTGVFHTLRAALPPMIAQASGRIVVISSMAGKAGFPRMGHYCATKWGVIGLAKSVAREVAAKGITVNVLCSTAVDTPMIHHDDAYAGFAPQADEPTRADMEHALASALNEIPVSYVPTGDVSSAVLFLCSDEARYVTGETLAVAAGQNARNTG